MKSILNAIAQFFTFGWLRKKSAGTITGFFFDGTTSWVANGKSEFLLPTEGWLIKPSVDEAGNVVTFRMEKPGTHDYWSLELAAEKGSRMRVGEFNHAARYPFQPDDAPGLDFSGCHRGNNRLKGKFTVLESTIKGTQILSFAANFIQYDECSRTSQVRGSMRYQSRLPLDFVTAEETPA